ncbi:Cof-type HAD-IIB family hydrolase [Halobacillus sp. BBL2006]|uniref:Cof-type HAD-IIB family hydrolase n=1 Tax=Halobacillus sp. BBL2006 TaxID=1543706 RepID=UPI000542C0A2|nr:Cof-type HAD-IIB family hydrolase [Halobacillus sp. BBL2006]KHE68362.1 phosphatase [Halobacillus sp. BBL2006]
MELIAIDMDGTLLNSQNTISQENIKAIKKAQEMGTEVVIATGRAEFDVRQILANTDLNTWVIGANGATIHQPNGTLFHSVPIEEKDAAEILEWLDEKQFYYEVFSDSSILTPQNGRALLQMELDRIQSANPNEEIEKLTAALEKQFSQTGFYHVDSYQEILEAGAPIYNVLAFSFEQEKLDLGWESFQSYPNLTLVSSAHHNFELEHKNASKGIALQKLSTHLGLSMDRTGAIGDSPNDLSMISMASHSAAMENGRPVVKEASDFVTKSNDDDGVAHTIYHWLK